MTGCEKILCIIPARGGSKGIPRKNLVDLSGKPLLAWSLAAAKAASGIDRIIVSTDSDEIAGVAREWGAEVPYIRPRSLAEDNVHAVHVVLHALDFLEKEENYKPAGVMMLLPTSPLRLSSDIDNVIDLFYRKQASSVVTVVDLGKYMTNLRYLNGDSLVRVAPDEDPNAQRQGLNKLYAVNGSIFLARPDVLRQEGTFHTNEALGYVMSDINSVDINSPDDLLRARIFSSKLDP
jgi:CMP-N,N'-diacetyllegionaminic acid synthase